MDERKVTIGLAGRARSGKSITARFLCVQYDAVYAPLASSLKGAAMQLLSPIAFFPSWKEEIRAFLQHAGTDVGRSKDREIWIKVWESVFGDCPRTVIPDVRFQNEIKLVHQRGGVVVFLGGIAPGEHKSERLSPLHCDTHIDIGGHPYKERSKLFAAVLNRLIELGFEPTPRKPRIYIGGGIHGLANFASVFHDISHRVEEFGMDALNPIEHEREVEDFVSRPFIEFATDIVVKDFSLIAQADGGLFYLDTPSMGAAMEILALAILDKPVAIVTKGNLVYHPWLHAFGKVFWDGFSGVDGAIKWLKSMLTI